MTKFPTPPSVNLNTSLGGGGSSARALSDFNSELSTTLANNQGLYLYKKFNYFLLTVEFFTSITKTCTQFHHMHILEILKNVQGGPKKSL